MDLVIFDIDGTLTDTNEVDETGFAEAVTREFGLTGFSTDWSDYEHCVDRFIVGELVRRHLERKVSPEELERFQSTFLSILRDEYARAPEKFTPIVGAAELLTRLRADSQPGIALATGGYRLTARFKLERAGLEVADLPLASADDGLARDEIIGAALARARSAYGVEQFARVVSVGDGLWDLGTARLLKMPFVGIAGGLRAERLRAAGADVVLVDFSDLEAAMRALTTARAVTLTRRFHAS